MTFTDLFKPARPDQQERRRLSQLQTWRLRRLLPRLSKLAYYCQKCSREVYDNEPELKQWEKINDGESFRWIQIKVCKKCHNPRLIFKPE